MKWLIALGAAVCGYLLGYRVGDRERRLTHGEIQPDESVQQLDPRLMTWDFPTLDGTFSPSIAGHWCIQCGLGQPHDTRSSIQ